MDILVGIQKFLNFINENWLIIMSIFTMSIIIAKNVKQYFSLPRDEKVAIAKKQISEIMLMFVTQAERDYIEWQKAGSIKRAQVIEKVLATYPILSMVTNQEEIIAWIDEAIDNALKEMRKIFEANVANG